LSVYVSEQLAAVPRLANLGPLFKSSPSPVELTESETEYIVRCIKHTFPHHVVFQVHSLPPTHTDVGQLSPLLIYVICLRGYLVAM